MSIFGGPHGHGGHHGGGGHHHGGHHHGGHHHGGGGRRWGGGYYVDSPYYYNNYAYTPSCPMLYQPVLGSDGKIYDNSCFAQANGAMVVRVLQPGDQVIKPGLSGSAKRTTTKLIALASVVGALVGLLALTAKD